MYIVIFLLVSFSTFFFFSVFINSIDFEIHCFMTANDEWLLPLLVVPGSESNSNTLLKFHTHKSQIMAFQIRPFSSVYPQMHVDKTSSMQMLCSTIAAAPKQNMAVHSSSDEKNESNFCSSFQIDTLSCLHFYPVPD